MSLKVFHLAFSLRISRTTSDGLVLSALTAVLLTAILVLLVLKLEVPLVVRRRQAAVVNPAVTHGNNTCAEAPALSILPIACHLLRVSSLMYEL